MGDTLHIIVSCCLEASRLDVLKATVYSLSDIRRDDVLVIDNGSTEPGVLELLSYLVNDQKQIVCFEQNQGYWSAVNWAIENHSRILGREFTYCYVIESDMVHYDYNRLAHAEEFLSAHIDLIASVRLQEFVVEEERLYDKLRPSPESRRWAWIRLSNYFSGENAWMIPSDVKLSHFPHRCYITNLVPQVPALNTMVAMKNAFAVLRSLEQFEEKDFQRTFIGTDPTRLRTGLLNGGIYNCKLSYEKSITSSYTDPTVLSALGYRPTRHDHIVPADTIALKHR